MGWIILIGIFVGVPLISALLGVDKDEIANEVEVATEYNKNHNKTITKTDL